MNFWRVLVCLLLPPLAVLDRGCGSILLVTVLTIAGWIPGIIAALVICNAGEKTVIVVKESSKSDQSDE